MDAKQLRELADLLFQKMLPLRSLWQEIADHFYPERADFTLWRPLGTDFQCQSDDIVSGPMPARYG